ncbi:MAG: protein-glutamate O-methyltransferase CheR [Methanomassiliicoccales archaeon]
MSINYLDRDKDFLELKRKILKECGLDCSQYKDSYLSRRFAIRMRARGASCYKDYLSILERNPEEYDALLNDLTINVTQFFRDPPVFKALEDEIIPILIYEKVMKDEGSIHIWSAGCSSGEEPYSVAMMISELLSDQAESFDIRILATDIDESILEKALEGKYHPKQLVSVPDNYINKYFIFDGDFYRITDSIKDMVDFKKMDLISQSPKGCFDMILCRNVVIYFTRKMQETLYMKFYNFLREGGYFVMGNTETLLGEASKFFIPINSKGRIYKKKDIN